jgi:hypothetical protein
MEKYVYVIGVVTGDNGELQDISVYSSKKKAIEGLKKYGLMTNYLEGYNAYIIKKIELNDWNINDNNWDTNDNIIGIPYELEINRRVNIKK